MPRCARLLMPLALLVLMTPAEASPQVRVYAADGRELHVGSVVSAGTLTNGVCSFAQDTAVTVIASTATPHDVSVSADSACRLVVTAIDSAVATASVNLYGHRVKVDRTDSARLAGDAGDAAVERVAGVGAEAGQSEPREYVGGMWVYDPADPDANPVYIDGATVRFTVDEVRGTVRHLSFVYGSCSGSLTDTVDTTGGVAGTLPCWFERQHDGPDHVTYVSGGTYAKFVGPVAVDRRELRTIVQITAATHLIRLCDAGALPPYWTARCAGAIHIGVEVAGGGAPAPNAVTAR